MTTTKTTMETTSASGKLIPPTEYPELEYEVVLPNSVVEVDVPKEGVPMDIIDASNELSKTYRNEVANDIKRHGYIQGRLDERHNNYVQVHELIVDIRNKLGPMWNLTAISLFENPFIPDTMLKDQAQKARDHEGVITKNLQTILNILSKQ